MKILVTVKCVIDFEEKLKIKDNIKICKEDVNMIMNPFDEIAVEEGLRLKEKHNGEVIIVSIGDENSTKQIRSALAMGADRGIWVSNKKQLDGYAIASILKEVVKIESPEIIIMGKQSIDDDSRQTAEMLSELLDYEQATQANSIKIDGNKVEIAREVDDGLETIQIDLPCIITTDLRLNEPRYASLPGIMKAKRKPLVEIESSKIFDDNYSPKLIIKKLEFPPIRKSGEIIPDIKTLILKLKNEAKII